MKSRYFLSKTRWLPALAIMVIIFASSSIPRGTIIPTFGLWEFEVKKAGHLLIYGLLAISYLWGIAGSRQVHTRHLVIAILMAALYGVSDELHQRLVPGRQGSVLDVGIDTLGATLGATIWHFSKRLFRE